MRSLRFVAPLVLGLSCALVPAIGQAQVTVSVTVGLAPPPLPVYAQPPMPAVGYIWTPGYWAWGPYGYYWVPGTWVLPPAPGLLWTPGYWAWENDAYVWFPGYWAPEVGFYGGIDYGFGYFGVGFVGGYWHDHRFFYNRVYNNFGRMRVDDVYERRVEVRRSYASYNGGRDGIVARPTPRQEAFARERHMPPTALQMQHFQRAEGDRNLWASVNHGRPPIAATSEPGRFDHAVAARPPEPSHPPAGRPQSRGPGAIPPHPGPAPHAPGGAPPAGYHPPMPTVVRPTTPPGRAPIRSAPPPRAEPMRQAPQQQHFEARQPGPGQHVGPGPRVAPAPHPQPMRPPPQQHFEARPPMPRPQAAPPHGPGGPPHPPARQEGDRRDQQHP